MFYSIVPPSGPLWASFRQNKVLPGHGVCPVGAQLCIFYRAESSEIGGFDALLVLLLNAPGFANLVLAVEGF